MIAVIATGGKQYLVKSGDVVKVEKLKGEKGDKVVFDKVLLEIKDNNAEVGNPYLSGVKVSAEIIDQLRAPKVRVEKFKNKTRYHKVYGHRQAYTKIKIA